MTPVFKSIYKFLPILVLCLWTEFVSAQVPGTKIKDGSVSGSAVLPIPQALLELESTQKGLLIPRMTTAERNAIATSQLTNSLLIFNTTESCFNYWNAPGSIWLSLCGTPPPAVFNITGVQCSAIQDNGVYKEGVALTPSNFLTVPVTVTQAGTYMISATTTNGYYFTTSGSFPNAGTYTLNLPGTGTPNSGYPLVPLGLGDTIHFTLNGASSACTYINYVEQANVDFSMTCSPITVGGSYLIGIPLTAANTITVAVNVATTGFWSISTNTVNGYSFSGTGTFTGTGNNTVVLQGTGTPLASGTNSFILTSNSNNNPACTGAQVTVATVGFTMNCATAMQNGLYMQAVPLTAANTITLPVNVTATGSYSISTNTVNGISFSASGNFTTLGVQNVTLVGTGTPVSPGTGSFTVTGNTGNCSGLQVLIQPQPVAYTMTCGSIITAGNYAPAIPMAGSNTMTVPINVTYVGAYTISSNTVNGISFSGSGTFGSTGAQNVVLTATGTPTAGGTFSFTVTSNSTSGSTTCPVSITFMYRTMRVLGIGFGTYQPGTAAADQTSGAVLMSTGNFGPNPGSKVKVQSVVLTNGATPSSAQLTTLINTNNIDIIVIGYSWAPDAASRAILVDFIQNKKGVVLNFSENVDASQNLARLLYNNNSITSTSQNGAGALYPYTNINDPVLNNVFGDVRTKYWGEDASGTDHLTNLPGSAIVYSLGNPSSLDPGVTSFRHSTLGYVWAGDGGFLSGDRTNTSDVIWPAKNDASSNPIPKLGYGTVAYGGQQPVYNSIFYANALAWAMGYVQINRP